MAALMQQSVPRDTSLLKFLETYIPEPASLVASNVPETAFYNQVAYYYSQNPAGFAPFDSVAATDGFQSMIVAPLQEAQTLFDNSPYLTRLASFISPPQMTKDPLFLFNSDIGDVSNIHVAQGVYECGDQQYSICDAPIRLTLPDGNVERLTVEPSTYCSYQTRTLAPAVAALPALATAWQRRDVGTGVVVTDNSLMIATTLAAASAVTPGNGPAGVGGSFGAGGSTGGGGMSGAGGGAGLGSAKAGSGCGCAVANPGAPPLAGLLPVALAALLLLRRRRAR